MRFENQVVWVTGASSGIGEACARAFASEGAKIILSGRRTDALNNIAGSINSESMILAFDTTDYEALPGIVEQACNWQGKIDILVNNAGVSQRSLAIDTHPSVLAEIINIDLLAPIWLTQLVLPRMVDAGGGHIVGVSSIAGRLGAPMRTGYSAAKHGLNGYLDALRSEVEKPYNIYVSNVLPGSFKTGISKNAFSADGTQRGQSDETIDNSRDPSDCAREIVNAVYNKTPELVVAEGWELELAQLRHSDPEKLFTMLSDMMPQHVADLTISEDHE